MKTTLKKAMSWLLLLSMLFSLAAAMAVGTSAATVAAPTDHATYGKYIGEAGANVVGQTPAGADVTNIQAYYNVLTATLTLVGTGPMKDYIPTGSTTVVPRWGDRPWDSPENDYRKLISKLHIKEGITTIGNGAFWGLQQCTEVSLPDSLTTIGEWAFCTMSALKAIVIPRNVTLVMKWAFKDSGLLTSNTIKSTCLGSPVIINEHFVGGSTNSELLNDLDAESLARVQMQETGYVGSLQWSFDRATGVLEITNPREAAAPMPDLIGTQPWQDYRTDIREVRVGAGITCIGAEAFKQASNLKTVVLGKDIVYIGEGAFKACVSLTSILLPDKTKYIDKEAFLYCGTVTVLTTNPQSFFMTDDKNHDGVVDTTVVGPADRNGDGKLDWIDGNGNGIADFNDTNYNGVWDSTETGKNGDSLVNHYALVSSIADGNAALVWQYNYKPSTNTVNNQIVWAYDAYTKTLTLTLAPTVSSASIPNYTAAGKAPWAAVGTITTVVMDAGITAIGDYAFAGLSSLTSITLKEGLTSIGKYALSSTALTSVALPASLLLVDEGAFTGCSYLTRATMLNNFTIINTPNRELRQALDDTAHGGGGTGTGGNTGTGTGTGGNTGTGTGTGNTNNPSGPFGTNGTWMYDTLNKKLFLYGNGTATIIPDYASSAAVPWATYADSIVSINVDSDVISIGNYAFYGCKSLTSVSLPTGLTRIGEKAFYGCEKLSKVDFPSTLSFIGKEAFYGCYLLTGVIFRSATLTIDSNAFTLCGLKKAVYLTGVPTGAGVDNALLACLVKSEANGTAGDINWSVDRAAGVLTLTSTGSGMVLSTDGWKDELNFVDTIIFGDGIRSIGANLLRGNSNLTSITAGNSVASIGYGAFESCVNLTDVTLPATLTTIGARAFYGCSKLEKIELPADLLLIAEETFAECTALTTIRVGEKVSKLGVGAFQNCNNLHTVELYATLSPLTAGVFTGCSKLTTINFNGTSAQWATLTAVADDVIKNKTPVLFVTKTIELVYEGGDYAGQVAQVITKSGKLGSVWVAELPASLNHYSPKDGSLTYTTTFDAATVRLPYTPTDYTITFTFMDADTNAILPWEIATPVKLTHFTPDRVIDTSVISLADVQGAEAYEIIGEQTIIRKGEMVGNRNIIVRCTKRSYTYTLEIINAETRAVIKLVEKTAKHGDNIAEDAPAVEGYEPVNKTYTLTGVIKNGEKVTLEYKPKTSTLKVYYYDADGKEHKVTTGEYKYDTRVEIPSPTIAGQTPRQAVVLLEQYKGEDKIEVYYDWKVYTITLSFVEADSDGHKIYPDYVAQVQHGQSFTYDFNKDDTREKLGYEPSESTVVIASVADNVSKVITFTPKVFTLTINYLDEDGSIYKTETELRVAGEEFVLASQEFRGYEPTQERSVTMGCEDLTIDIQLVDAGMGALGVIIIILIIVAVLVGGGLAFYFIYLKRA